MRERNRAANTQPANPDSRRGTEMRGAGAESLIVPKLKSIKPLGSVTHSVTRKRRLEP